MLRTATFDDEGLIRHASDQRKWWALRVSNPRPSPCKGEEEVLVRGLTCGFGCRLSTSEYVRCHLSCYADVMRGALRRAPRAGSSVTLLTTWTGTQNSSSPASSADRSRSLAQILLASTSSGRRPPATSSRVSAMWTRWLSSATSPRTSQLVALAQLHREVVDEMPSWEDRVEVVYVSTEALTNFRTDSSNAARISPGEPFHEIRVDHRWLIDWYQLREVGQVLYGPPVTTLVPVITNAEYVEAVRQHVLDWPDPEVGESQGSLAYAIITLCRGLRTIRTGTLVSKREAARWGCSVLPDHARFIRDAIGWRERARILPQIADEKAADATKHFVEDLRHLVEQEAKASSPST